MGAQLSLITPSANTIGLEAYILELETVLYEKRLSHARFLKTVKGRDPQGPVVIKVFIKPTPGIHLDPYARELQRQSQVLQNVSNTLTYTRLLETDRAGYLVRQYLRTNLYDRIATRPFMTPVEKRWMTYQLLRGVHECHLKEVVHGDIKTENIMVTSAANWLYLTDFAPYKPTYLPQDDPAPFSFYFDTSLRRCCYLAPERFVDTEIEGPVTIAMDIFSLGCVIAELFLEGTPIFTLSQLFKYKKGEYDPPLHYIDDVQIRDMVRNMIHLDPAERGTTEGYLEKFDSGSKWFGSFWHPYISELVNFNEFSTELTESFNTPFQMVSNHRIERVYNDFALIAKFLDFDISTNGTPTDGIILDIPGLSRHIPQIRPIRASQDNALLVLSLICADIRNVTRTKYKLMAGDLILALGEQVSDEAKLDRCVPYLLTLLDDFDPLVQITGLTHLCHLLTLVTILTPVNDALFVEYIIPKLAQTVLSSPKISVRAAYARCLSSLVTTAARFQAMSLLTKSSEIDTLDLQNSFEEHTVTLLTDPSAAVKCSLLSTITPLCRFFGESKTNDIILSHLITYLNDRDVKVKLAFFDATLELSSFIGSTSLELYVLPLLAQTLTDSDEFVVQKILQCLTLFTDNGLIRTPYIWDLVRGVVKFLVHPNNWIRITCIAFIAATARRVSPAERYCRLYPLLRPFLVCDLVDFDEITLVPCVKPALTRSVFNLVITWAAQAEKSAYWKISHQRRHNVRGGDTAALGASMLSESIALRYNGSVEERTVSSKVEMSSEDETWLGRLQSLGFRNKDLWKINVLRDFIYNISHSGNHKVKMESINLAELKIMPRNVFFDDKPRVKTVVTPVITTASPIINPIVEVGLIGTTNRVKFATNGITSLRSSPSTGTMTTTAYGEVETPGRGSTSPNTVTGTTKSPPSHSYGGTDPYILHLLDTFSHDLESRIPLAFGPRVSKRQHINVNDSNAKSSSRRNWRPAGILVSSLHEHTAGVVRLGVSPDHEFLVSAGEDGLVKVWDTSRFESTGSVHAALTYNVDSSAEDTGTIAGVDGSGFNNFDNSIKAMCMLDNYHVIIITTADGWVKALRIYMRPKTAKTTRAKYKRIEVVASYNININNPGVLSSEYASDIHTVQMDNQLWIILITTDCRIIILDTSTMQPIHTMFNPPDHGWLTAAVVDKAANWILVGTSKGILDLWDLRFQLLIKSWAINGSAMIHRLVLHPLHEEKWVCVAGGSGQGEITVWDIETAQCMEVYRGSGNPGAGKGYDAGVVNDNVIPPVDENVESLSKDHIIKVSDQGSHAVWADTEFEYSPNTLEYTRRPFMLVAGSDKVIRWWDLRNIESSGVINGLATAAGKPVYTISYPTSSMTLNTEKLYLPHYKENDAKRPGKLPRASIISAEQRESMRNHHDTVVDVVVVLSPYKMVVSADRMGVIKVFS